MVIKYNQPKITNNYKFPANRLVSMQTTFEVLTPSNRRFLESLGYNVNVSKLQKKIKKVQKRRGQQS